MTHSARTLLREPPRSLRRARGPAEGLKARQRAGAASGASRATASAWRASPSGRGARWRTATQRLQARVAHSGQLLGALSYRSVLARGFALVRDEQGHAVRAAAGIGPGARLDLEFSDGRVAATADADRPPAPSPAKPAASEPKAATPKRVGKPVDQGSLF